MEHQRSNLDEVEVVGEWKRARCQDLLWASRGIDSGRLSLSTPCQYLPCMVVLPDLVEGDSMKC